MFSLLAGFPLSPIPSPGPGAAGGAQVSPRTVSWRNGRPLSSGLAWTRSQGGTCAMNCEGPVGTALERRNASRPRGPAATFLGAPSRCSRTDSTGQDAGSPWRVSSPRLSDRLRTLPVCWSSTAVPRAGQKPLSDEHLAGAGLSDPSRARGVMLSARRHRRNQSRGAAAGVAGGSDPPHLTRPAGQAASPLLTPSSRSSQKTLL